MNPAKAAPNSAGLVEFLSRTSSYPDRPSAVQVVETHISWVFLTDRHAYKLKKPVRFEFLDFSTPERRQQACQEEVRLNRRLAPDVYLGVLPVTQTADGLLGLGGRGTEVDWVVHMRRLPAEDALDVVLRERRLVREDASGIADHLVEFYARLPSAPVPAESYRQALERHIRANGASLLEANDVERNRIRRIQSAQLRYLMVQADWIGQRATDGRIVEGHGDLRPEHVYLVKPPAVIDCIEFSQELRTVDIADELSFLAMECQRLGDGGLGELVVARYQTTFKEPIPESLLAFYRAYRACVRAKVVLLRRRQQAPGSQSPDGLFRQYLDLADRNAAELGAPTLVIVGGLMGTGKSTLAEALAQSFGVEVLSTDHIRRELLGASASPADYGEGHYRPEIRRQIYNELFHKADELLHGGQSVVLDGTFLTQELREQAHRLGGQHGAVSLYVHCTCPRATALARIEARARSGRSRSEARGELYDLQAQEFDPPQRDEPAVTVDTTHALRQQLETVCRELRRRLFP
jgi:aminoglycoside phosphotransferase family enzyme/predicted kinase